MNGSKTRLTAQILNARPQKRVTCFAPDTSVFLNVLDPCNLLIPLAHSVDSVLLSGLTNLTSPKSNQTKISPRTLLTVSTVVQYSDDVD